jgi:hypothetical protein
MKYIKQLLLLVEGIGSSRNFYKNIPSFESKDDNILSVIDNLFIIKKFIEYLNDEINDFNKKSLYKKPFFIITLNESNTSSDYFYILHNFLKNKTNINETKTKFIEKTLELFKNEIKNLNDLFQLFNEYHSFEFNIKTDNNKYEIFGSLKSSFRLNSIIHDLLMHFFIDERIIYKFRGDSEGYEFQNPFKFSPENILNELNATKGDAVKDYKEYFKYVFKSFYDDFIFNKDQDNFNLDVFFKKISVSKKFLNELINFLKFGPDYNIYLKYDVSYKDLQDLMIFLNKYYQSYFISTIKNIKDFLKNKYFSNKTNYPFIQNVIFSIEYRKKRIKKEQIKTTWGDFRLFFRNYPNVVKLFPESKYPNELIIYDEEYDEYDFIETDDEKIIKINDMVDTAVNSVNLLKKINYKKSDIKNPQDKIDFVLEKIINLIKNNLNDNSRFYKMIETKIK